jgi:two-component system, NarL family, sensor kinase
VNQPLPRRAAAFLLADPIRVSAFLRLPLIALIAVLVWFWEVNHWLPVVYAVLLGSYAVAATWVVLVLRGEVPPWTGWASTAGDVAVIVALCIVSGGATAALLPVFFVLPVSVAFQVWPLTITLASAVCYLAAWIVYGLRDDRVDVPEVAYTHFGFLVWLAVALTALCFVLSQRQARVTALLAVRRQLVSEVTQADERQHRELAENLHDGPLQTVLAARLGVDELRERVPDPALDAIYDALQVTATSLRSTVTALDPQVLARLGLSAGVSELLRQFESRYRCTVDADLQDVGKPESQALMYRAARELLNNVGRHARATRVWVTLERNGDRIVLTLRDDGVGFEVDIIDPAVAEGHIGLASLMVRCEAMGGVLKFDSQPGNGTRVTVTSPPEPESND